MPAFIVTLAGMLLFRGLTLQVLDNVSLSPFPAEYQNTMFIARTAATVVIADMLFTASAVVVQPLTGAMLMMLTSTTLAERWLAVSLGLYLLAGLLWIPVIFMQIEMRDLARSADAQRQALPPRYFALFRR